jgi:hypothetical protein
MKRALVAAVGASFLFACALRLDPTTDPDAPAGKGAASETKGSGTDHPATGRSSGPIVWRLVDAPAEVESVVVTIDRIDVHVEGSEWTTVVEHAQTFDLLKLRNGSAARLGVHSLPTGHVTGMRLVLSESQQPFVKTTDGVDHPLRVPSGTESGIKITADFDVDECQAGAVTLDFDAEESLRESPVGQGTPDGGKKPRDAGPSDWILRPVIHLKDVRIAGGCEDAAPPLPEQEEAAGEDASAP